MANSKIDYYKHVITNNRELEFSNNSYVTYYLNSSDRDIKKYPNKYNCVIDLHESLVNIKSIELVKAYINYNTDRLRYISKNTEFKANFIINDIEVPFKTLIVTDNDVNNIDNENIIQLFTHYYINSVEPQLKIWLGQNNSNKTYSMPRLYLKYNMLNNTYYIQKMNKDIYIDNSSISMTENDLFSNHIPEVNNTDESVFFVFPPPPVEEETDGFDDINYDTFGFHHANNTFIKILGEYDNNYKTNITELNNIEVNVVNSQYISTSIKVIGLTLLYNDGTIEVTNDNYKNNVVLNDTYINVIPTYNNGLFQLETNTRTVDDYRINLRIEKVTNDIIEIVVDNNVHPYMYSQLLNTVLTKDSKNGVKLEFTNLNSSETIIIENFDKTTSLKFKPTYDLTYFNNVPDIIEGKEFIIHSGYIGYKTDANKLKIYVSILSSNYVSNFRSFKGKNDYTDPPLTSLNFNAKRILVTVPEIYDNIYHLNIQGKKINYIPESDIQLINYWSYLNTPIFTNNQFNFNISYIEQIIYDDYLFQNNNETVKITTNFIFFSSKTDSNETEVSNTNNNSFENSFLIVNISELNNKLSNNNHLNRSFIELPLNNSGVVLFDSSKCYSTKYFNPPLVNLNRLSINITDSSGNILSNSYGDDFIFIFNIEQYNTSKVVN